MIIQKTFKNTNPTIYLVGTPIGNLADISFRAIEILKSVDLIYCEDTRTSQTLLKKYEINNKLLSLHKYNELERVDQFNQQMQAHKSIAIISDAGVPIISDPGGLVINKLFDINPNFNVSAVNCGPAYIHALVCSRFNAKQNYFHGFLEAKTHQTKVQELNDIIDQVDQQTIITFYESVHRVSETLLCLKEILAPNQKLAIVRELTKLNEEVIVLEACEIEQLLNEELLLQKGEFVIVIDQIVKQTIIDFKQLIAQVDNLVKQGTKLKTACEIVSANDMALISKNDLYKQYILFKKI